MMYPRGQGRSHFLFPLSCVPHPVVGLSGEYLRVVLCFVGSALSDCLECHLVFVVFIALVSTASNTVTNTTSPPCIEHAYLMTRATGMAGVARPGPFERQMATVPNIYISGTNGRVSVSQELFIGQSTSKHKTHSLPILILPLPSSVKVFVDMKYKDGTTNSDDQITGLLTALLFAGQHTSSITSTWTTLLATRYSRCHVQAKDTPSTYTSVLIVLIPLFTPSLPLSRHMQWKYPPIGNRHSLPAYWKSSSLCSVTTPTHPSRGNTWGKWSCCTTACARRFACTRPWCVSLRVLT